jgi:outer membrane protein assembly factor BamB
MMPVLRRAAWPLVVLAVLAGCDRPILLDGPRFDVRTPTEVLLATAEPTPPPQNRRAPLALPAPVANADWTHRAGSPAHVMPHLALSPAAERLWSLPIGAGNARRSRITAAPVVARGVVYAMDAAARVSAVSTAGAVLWQADVALPGEPPETAAGGGLAVAGGRLFVTTGFGELLVLDAQSGAVQWRRRFDGPLAGAPTVGEGAIYVAGRDGAGYAVDAADGKLRWLVPGVPQAIGRANAPAPALAGELALFPFAAGEVIAVNRRDGVPVWAAQAAGARTGRAAALLSDMTGDPVVAGAVTYLGSAAGRTVAVETQTGLPRWNAPHGAMGPVFPAGGAVFLVDDLGRLVRLDAATGETVWAVEVGLFTEPRLRRQRDVVVHYGPVVAGGRVWLASSDGAIRLFDPADGALYRSIPLPGGAAAAPAVAGGTLYVVSGDGQLHAFR